MNTQSIKIIEDRIKYIKNNASLINTYGLALTDTEEMIIEELEEISEEISYLPSLDIDSLWNYDYTETWMEYVWTAWMWEYIRYDDLKKLLQDTLELNQ